MNEHLVRAFEEVGEALTRLRYAKDLLRKARSEHHATLAHHIAWVEEIYDAVREEAAGPDSEDPPS